MALLIFGPPFILYIVGSILLEQALSHEPRADLGLALLGFLLWLAALGALVAAFLPWYYKVNRELITVTGRTWNVGLWTGMLVLPVVQWISLYKLADHVHRAQLSRGFYGVHPVVLFLLLVIVPFVGVPIVQTQINRVW